MATPLDDAPLLGKALLARIIQPRPGEPSDVRSLYLTEAVSNNRRAHATSRTSLLLGPESEVSFCTYFNAFPASYWRRWTDLTTVVLRLELRGHCRVDIYRSKADGRRIGVADREVPALGHPRDAEADDTVRTVEFEVDLTPFEDGGWIWFDLTTDTETEILSGGWYAPVPAPGRASVALGMPTFNRPTDCVNALAALVQDPLVLEAVQVVLVPDQGTRKARDEPGFTEAAAALGGRLRMFDQGNIGGSGGYSRVMYEALENTDCDYIQFMDDDIQLEPDSILRSLAFARFARTPVIVGGQMLNLQNRSHLLVMGEVVDLRTFNWGAAPHAEYDHDFHEDPLLETEELHRRIDVDYNGWWMCMIPRVVAEQTGQPLPLFIKWDDAEYSLRAAKLGFPTVTLPGAAIWHMAWGDKDDAIDWQAYFHLRNRLVVAALHKPGGAREIVTATVKHTVKHLLCLEYSTVALHNLAIRDFLDGPGRLFDLLPTALPTAAQLRKQYPDAQVVESATKLPLPSGADVGDVSLPTNPVAKVARLAKAVKHGLTKANPEHFERPQLNVPNLDARWFLLSQVDGVTVTTADGRGVFYRKRDRDKAYALFKEAMALRRELARRFDELKAEYRAALPELTSKERWADVFAQYN